MRKRGKNKHKKRLHPGLKDAAVGEKAEKVVTRRSSWCCRENKRVFLGCVVFWRFGLQDGYSVAFLGLRKIDIAEPRKSSQKTSASCRGSGERPGV